VSFSVCVCLTVCVSLSVNVSLLQNNLWLILIPVVFGIGILIRKKNLLEPIFDRFPVVENILNRFGDIFERLGIMGRFETIKEKIPIIKNR